ncbi:DUF6221 family protein [Nocardia cyriacigeorgica]|uniref:DUF6221 family protein n=1 Tax=Nocardia cyriacigeorgica TaxID=135487 RepID=UPI0018937226|nr:DUF6221 family protein [Nocardia cyriacigeorgica]MBF6289300.1 hypothetical protein [Nocardia cyriacigeorgica]
MTNKATCPTCGVHLSAIYRGEPCPNGCNDATGPSVAEFIAARLDEDEQIANTAGTGKYARWAYAPDSDRTDDAGAKFADGEIYQPDTRREIRCPNNSYYEYGLVTRDSEGITPSVEPNQAHHIARHDPARAQRQAVALRVILDDHSNDEGYCGRCWDGDSYAPASRMFPCPTIRSLAAIWSDHTDYRQEWKP